MKQFFCLCFAFSFLAACQQKQPVQDRRQEAGKVVEKADNNTDSSLTRSEKMVYENSSLEFGHHIRNPNGEYSIIPIVIKEIIGFKGEDNSFLFSNLLFLNSKTGELRKIDEQFPGYIKHLNIFSKVQPKAEDDYSSDPDPDHDYELKITTGEPAKSILLHMANPDLRLKGQSKTNSYTTYFAAIQANGEKFTILTPLNAHVHDWELIDNGTGVIFYYTVDDNKNGQIDADDSEQATYVNLHDPKPGKILMDDNMRDALIKESVAKKKLVEE